LEECLGPETLPHRIAQIAGVIATAIENEPPFSELVDRLIEIEELARDDNGKLYWRASGHRL
jgi:hypothetical protein